MDKLTDIKKMLIDKGRVTIPNNKKGLIYIPWIPKPEDKNDKAMSEYIDYVFIYRNKLRDFGNKVGAKSATWNHSYIDLYSN